MHPLLEVCEFAAKRLLERLANLRADEQVAVVPHIPDLPREYVYTVQLFTMPAPYRLKQGPILVNLREHRLRLIGAGDFDAFMPAVGLAMHGKDAGDALHHLAIALMACHDDPQHYTEHLGVFFARVNHEAIDAMVERDPEFPDMPVARVVKELRDADLRESEARMRMYEAQQAALRAVDPAYAAQPAPPGAWPGRKPAFGGGAGAARCMCPKCACPPDPDLAA